MANRVTHNQVLTIRDTAIADVTPFIDVAHALVDSMNSSLNEDRLTLIELWLSAHFVEAKEPTVISDKFEGVDQKFAAIKGEGIMSTFYGQTADMLSGGLLSNSSQAIATVTFL